MRVLICGSRDYGFKLEQRDQVFNVIAEETETLKNPYTSEYENLTIIQGGAKGVDKAAGHWAVGNNVPQEVYPADWEKYGKAAGPIRNKQMLDEGKPDLVIAFINPGSKGTRNMIDQAKKAGVPVKEVEI
jgi:hypothetical protein